MIVELHNSVFDKKAEAQWNAITQTCLSGSPCNQRMFYAFIIEKINR